ncbi:MAG TPA: hypothetical protein VE957_05305, partial [Terriglobales bacterium]|nr:hypothetical protein [Terriglobales bacterium]
MGAEPDIKPRRVNVAEVPIAAARRSIDFIRSGGRRELARCGKCARVAGARPGRAVHFARTRESSFGGVVEGNYEYKPVLFFLMAYVVTWIPWS